MARRPTILVVEDDSSDELLTLRAIYKSEIQCEVLVARDGVEACSFMDDPTRPLPSLILLDLKLPLKNGIEVLQHIRSNELTKRIPVVVFSSSDEEGDIFRSLDFHANSYVQKCVDAAIYQSRLKVLLYYWLGVHGRAVQPAMNLVAGM